jgi:hypothetical protein
MTVTFPIISLLNGEVADPAWFVNITESVNDHESRIDTLESQVSASSASNVDTTTRTTASTTYTTTLSPANICGTAFVAPTSGKVFLAWHAEQANSGAASGAYTAASIRAGSTVGSGTSFVAASDQNATLFLDSVATQFHHAGTNWLITGLTPGATYNVALEHRANAGTGTFQRREVSVIPLIA